jgi:hypothetical protein
MDLNEQIPFYNVTPTERTATTYNYLSPTAFRVIVPKLPRMTHFVQSVSIPSVVMGSVEIPAYKGLPKQEAPSYLDITDEIIINFHIDENMENWQEVYNWMSSIVPTDRNDASVSIKDELYSEIIVLVYSNSKVLKKKITFHKCYPTNLSSFEFNSSSSDIDPITITSNFQYSHFTFETV